MEKLNTKNNKPFIVKGTIQDTTNNVIQQQKYNSALERWKFAIENTGVEFGIMTLSIIFLFNRINF